MIRTFRGSVLAGAQMENDVMDTACQNNNPHLNPHVTDILHLTCQTCKMDCLQKPARGTSIVLKFRVLTWGEKKDPTLKCRNQKSLQNLTLCSFYFFTFVSTSRPRPLCHLAHNSWCDILWCTLDTAAHEWPPGVRDSSWSFLARLSRIKPLSVFKKLEDQASNRKNS